MNKFLCFEATTNLPASPAEVFAFHENPLNLTAISPSTMHVLSVDAKPRAVVGDSFHIQVRQFFVTIHWVGRWESVVQDRLLTDSALHSPFASWLHEHHFEPDGCGGTHMSDRVTLAPHGGALLAWFAKPFIRLALASMFRSRHLATQKYFS